MKIKCDKCGRWAQWFNIGSSVKPCPAFCDNCVDRGCSCNSYPLTDDLDGPWENQIDDQGREYPCCDYIFFKDGWEEDE